MTLSKGWPGLAIHNTCPVKAEHGAGSEPPLLGDCCPTAGQHPGGCSLTWGTVSSKVPLPSQLSPPTPAPSDCLPSRQSHSLGQRGTELDRSVCSTQRPEAPESDARAAPVGWVTAPARPRATECLGPWLPRGLVFSRSAKTLNFYMKSELL